MLMYCESNDHKDTIIFDVSNLESLKELYEMKKLQEKWIKEDDRSFIEVENVRYEKYKGPREGVWYDIPIYFWEECEFDFDTYSFYAENPSLIFRLRVTFPKGENKEGFDFSLWKVGSG